MRHEHYKPYVELAQKYGYEVHIRLVGDPKDPQHKAECAKRNTHGVPLERYSEDG